MHPQIVNLTLLCVSKEIESILVDYPTYPYQVLFSIPYWRKKLTAYVLNHLPNRHVVVEEIEKLREEFSHPQCPIEEGYEIKNLICEGITEILQDNPDWLSRQTLKQN